MFRTDRLHPAPATRRALLKHAAWALLPMIGGLPALQARAASAATAIRLSLPAAGSAGSIWRPVSQVRRMAPAGASPIDWIGGSPGQTQSQLLAGAVDIAAIGAIGVVESNLKGGDIVMFAPALNNHGSWIVRGDSAFRSIGDLKGHRIATQPLNTDTFRHAQMAVRLAGFDLKKDFEVIHGPPLANLALFERRDVDAVITIEPTSTRLIAKGARELARVGDQWRVATGDAAPLLLVGQGARRAWIDAHAEEARALGAFYVELNRAITQSPKLLQDFHAELGIPATESAAIELLPKRLGQIFPDQWNAAVFTNIDRQLAEAIKLGVLPKASEAKAYVSL